MEFILPKNINKAPKKMENVNHDGNKWDNEKFVFKKWLPIRQIYAYVKIK